jgi:spermidine/putrescine transport system ATP-binding protein
MGVYMAIDLSVREISKVFGDFTAVDKVSFRVEKGNFFTILGPSGCGKTTLLYMIAGFHKLSGGAVEIRGKDMSAIEPNKRPVNLVFQHLALFPMMDVKENIAFGLKRKGERGPAVYKKVNDMLERVGLPGFENKKIDHLSGGQKQRVAIARCLILNPAVLLLDEPLGALDLKLREHMKVELKKLQSEVGTTFVYITHDQSEAMVMSDFVAVMNAGRFEQIDTPQNLYSQPNSSFVAQFVGENNKFTGIFHKDENANFYVVCENNKKYVIANPGNFQEGDRVEMFIRPEDIAVDPEDKNCRAMNVMDVTIKTMLFDGSNSRLLVAPVDEKKPQKELIVHPASIKRFNSIKSGDKIKIGWEGGASVCFKISGQNEDHQ